VAGQFRCLASALLDLGDLRRCDARRVGQYHTHVPLIRPIITETTFGSGVIIDRTLGPHQTGAPKDA